jgi:signal transduction histidine kinase
MALLFTVLLSISAGILGYFLYDFGRQGFMRETEAAIDAEIGMLSTIKPQHPRAVMEYISQRATRDSAVHFRYEDENGRKLAGSIESLPADIQPITEGVLRFTMERPEGKQLLAAKIHTFQDGARMVVARDIHGLTASYERLKHLSILIMALMLAVVLVSFAISYFVVSRINRIASTARSISETGDLSRRISIDSSWDDISNLSQVLNGFLEQIERLMTGIREVSNNIAHDLRTPLAGLRSDIESLKGRRVSEQHLDSLLAEADRILAIFQSLLRITNIEQGRRHHGFASVDLGLVLHDVAELYEPLAEEKRITLHLAIADGLTVNGDADLLFQLFANLLDNAIKFAPPASSVFLHAAYENGRIITTLEDEGPGIADTERELVFRHFYRGDASRTTPGNGLGLSLVKAIVQKHLGCITLQDSAPGLRVRIELQPYQ